MNSCILLVTVAQNPELRYTQDNQTPVTQMMVEFDSDRPGEPPYPLKVVGWGNLATEMQQTYHPGDRLIVEGRLSIRNVDRPEGFKEKQGELVASRIYALGADASLSSTAPVGGDRESADRPAAVPAAAGATKPRPEPIAPPPPPIDTGNFDDIPF